MENRRIPVSLGDFSLVDPQLSKMRQRFSDEMIRMDNEMSKIMSEMGQPFGQSSSVNESALITDVGGRKALKLTFDVSQYQPDEVTVETTDEKIIVHAKHEEKSANKNVFMEYHREFSIPNGTNPESIDISLSNDGVLVATVPYFGQLNSGAGKAIEN